MTNTIKVKTFKKRYFILTGAIIVAAIAFSSPYKSLALVKGDNYKYDISNKLIKEGKLDKITIENQISKQTSVKYNDYDFSSIFMKNDEISRDKITKIARNNYSFTNKGTKYDSKNFYETGLESFSISYVFDINDSIQKEEMLRLKKKVFERDFNYLKNNKNINMYISNNSSYFSLSYLFDKNKKSNQIDDYLIVSSFLEDNDFFIANEVNFLQQQNTLKAETKRLNVVINVHEDRIVVRGLISRLQDKNPIRNNFKLL